MDTEQESKCTACGDKPAAYTIRHTDHHLCEKCQLRRVHRVIELKDVDFHVELVDCNTCIGICAAGIDPVIDDQVRFSMGIIKKEDLSKLINALQAFSQTIN